MTDNRAATARAHPNIALVKYWGKQSAPGNLPATPNLSVTLAALTTTTTVSTAEGTQDQLRLNGQPSDDRKVHDWLHTLRAQGLLRGALQIETSNNFPTAAGLASSASGFAALIAAINAHCDLDLDRAQQSALARQGSASAARSLFGGYVSLTGPDWQATPIAAAEHWALDVVVAVTSEAAKAVGSTAGMQRSAETSPYYQRWVDDAPADYALARAAIEQRNFDQLAQVAEHNCLKMHALMLTSWPTLSYWQPATLACMDEVRAMRASGLPVFFTIDAGPQVKAVCLPDATSAVAARLQQVPGVTNILTTPIGGDPTVSIDAQ